MMSRNFTALSGALVVGLLLAACKGDPAPAPEAKSEPSPKTTEAAKTTPPAAMPPPTLPGKTADPTPAAKAPEAPPAPALAAPGAGQEAPAVADGKSAPPSVAEWTAAPSANTVGANSAPRDCELKVVREWLKVNCQGNIKEVTNREGFGVKNADYFELVTPGKVVDFVIRMKKGQAIKARIIREGQSASLFMNWPSQSAKPSIIALQIFNPPA